MKPLDRMIHRIGRALRTLLTADIYFGRHPSNAVAPAIIFFPCYFNTLCCGIAGIVSFKKKPVISETVDVSALSEQVDVLKASGYSACKEKALPLDSCYLGGKSHIRSLLSAVRSLKKDDSFFKIYKDSGIQKGLSKIAHELGDILLAEKKQFSDHMGHLEVSESEIISKRIEDLKDIHWCLNTDIGDNIKKVRELMDHSHDGTTRSSIIIFKKINTVLNSIDRLEVRGRDSAGISLLFILDEGDFKQCEKFFRDENLSDRLNKRVGQEVLLNQGVHVQPINNGQQVAVTLTYKIAAEIGRLGDNIRSLRQQIRSDSILQRLATLPHVYDTVMTHTRWASVGAITEANGCPIDNKSEGRFKDKKGWIHVCLNGDIDNYLELKTEYEKSGGIIHPDVTTDTKIIPLQIEKYVSQGHAVEEAFRMAVNDFQGSHAISMHTDLEPGKLFLAQKGSGQALFVGISDDHYMASSEVYGFVEETSKFIRMNGDQIIEGRNGKTQGQVFILDQESGGDLDGITAMYYDGTPIAFKADDIQETEITSRDIDRQNYPHYFFKEISEAPASVEKTLQNRWKISADPPHHHGIVLDERTIPHRLRSALAEGKIRRIFFIGQGTAGVAALACSNILNTYLNNPSILIGALKASELSGFNLGDPNDTKSMADTLIVAISQSGTTTDTNRTVEMVRERGAHTIAIVNRRDSDITFKVDGVLYTSSGRDIEMSVASTKAFYSQITAGAVLSLYIARLQNRIDDTFVTAEVKQLLQLPVLMREILSKKELMEKSARRLAASKTYWAAVGSGPNKASADEIRIKLSELCYKTISSDFVEDKKHIDLSSEPLIIVCAAGSREAVLGDIIKDTAIFHAHKATPVVIANEGEDRFDPYAEDVFYIPVVAEHFAPILNTLVGHIWGYYAALSINEGSQLLYGFQNEIQQTIDAFVKEGLDVYEVILEKSFREKIARFYEQFRKRKSEKHFSTAIAQASDIALLLKYLSGRLPVSDFELDFGKKGTALNMLNTLFEYLGESINRMARPIDAIKHQAKTVTVGTSRISDRVEGILYDEFFDYQFQVSQLTPSNVIVLRNLQGVVSKINGSILYRINKLDLLGETTEETTIELSDKRGKLKSLTSRVETDNELKGTKRIIAREGNVYIGLGRKDERSIIIIPIISDTALKPSIIEYLLLLNISFKEQVPLPIRTKALGGKYERIKNMVQENSIDWDDQYLEGIELKELFGWSAEKIAESIVSTASA